MNRKMLLFGHLERNAIQIHRSRLSDAYDTWRFRHMSPNLPQSNNFFY
jgi:hypothetical protein